MLKPALMRACRALASLKLTLAALVFFAAGILVAYLGEEHTTLALVLPLLLLSLNLIAAVLTNPAFRRSGALLLFHMALIAIVLLVTAGRLTYLKGHVELSEGESFDGQLTASEAGPWHQSGLDRVHFTNDGFSIEYAPGIQRGKTRNAVQYTDARGKEQHAEIGDQTPLVLEGYRFYTSSNKGFAPAFLWTPAAGREPVLGTVHLPSYPVNEGWQARAWQLPGTGIQLWTMLKFDEIILDPNAASEFRLPHRHKVIVRIGGQRHELLPGQAISLPGGGRLVYDGLRTWMGYTVFYDWTIHWLLAASVIAVGALGWHFWRKFAAQPWNT
ncbi:MAG: cytochrome c biogenesis protein ResB [Sulfuricella sp.]